MGRRNIKLTLAVAGAMAASSAVLVLPSSPVQADVTTTVTSTSCTAYATTLGAGAPQGSDPDAVAPIGAPLVTASATITIDHPAQVAPGETFSVDVDFIDLVNGPVAVDENENDLRTNLQLTNADGATPGTAKTGVGTSVAVDSQTLQYPGASAPSGGTFEYPATTHSMTVSPGVVDGQTVDISIAPWSLHNFAGGVLVFCDITGAAATVSIPVVDPLLEPPTVVDDAATIFLGDPAFDIAILDNDFDNQGTPGTFGCDAGSNIDPATVVTDTAGTLGTVGAFDPIGCVINYDPTGVPEGTDSFTYTVNDVDTNTSASATVTITILPSGCIAGTAAENPAPGCTLDQTLQLTVLAGNLSMVQAGPTVVMTSDIFVPGTPITLNGLDQTAYGAIQQITVTDARGNPAANWSLSMELVGDIERVGGTGTTSDVIEAVHLASNSHVCTVVAGEDAVVTAGAPGTFDTTITLCSALDPTLSGGTFTADSFMTLNVPASVNAGDYQGTIQFTLA